MAVGGRTVNRRGRPTQNEHGKWGVSQRKSGRGRQLTGGNSAPYNFSRASHDNGNDGDVIPSSWGLLPVVVRASPGRLVQTEREHGGVE
jgi:hypothetical protein